VGEGLGDGPNGEEQFVGGGGGVVCENFGLVWVY